MVSCVMLHLPNVKVVQAAIRGHREQVTVKNPDDGAWQYQVRPVAENEGAIDWQIPAVTITELIVGSGYKVADLVKLDIEGSEFKSFQRTGHGWNGSG